MLTVYLNAKAIRAAGVTPAAAEAALAEWAAKQYGVQAAYTRARLSAGGPAGDDLERSVRQSFYPDRCGDVYVAWTPYYLASGKLGTGTTHGTPYEYDTYVPLLVYGAGVTPGVRKERVAPLSAAAILATAAGIAPTGGATAPVPDKLLGTGK